MIDMREKLEPKDFFAMNAKLQAKKNKARAALAEMGVLKREGNNNYDKYKYFSEAQYKELFTSLLSKNGLELNFTEIAYEMFEGPEKQANGRVVRLEFVLTDTETGFYETATVTGEGIDKGDKAGYKAMTGALKYYFADVWCVATGDDAEKDSPNFGKMNDRKPKPTGDKISPAAANKLMNIIKQAKAKEPGFWADISADYGIEKVSDVKISDYNKIVQRASAIIEAA